MVAQFSAKQKTELKPKTNRDYYNSEEEYFGDEGKSVSYYYKYISLLHASFQTNTCKASNEFCTDDSRMTLTQNTFTDLLPFQLIANFQSIKLLIQCK